MPDPIDRSMVNDRYEPRGKAGFAGICVAREACKVVGAKIAANLREYIRHIIVVIESAPNYGEYQPAIPLDEEVAGARSVARGKSCTPQLHR